MQKFLSNIRAMNEMYSMPVVDKPALYAGSAEATLKRLEDFEQIALKELREINDIRDALNRLVAQRDAGELTAKQVEDTSVDILVSIYDWHGDNIVYHASEAMKYGSPTEAVLTIIMESNFSKLGADGHPIKDENGKVLKGPNFFPPEPKLKEMVLSLLADRVPSKPVGA